MYFMIYFIDTTYKDNSLKFKSLAFWRKKTPFIDQKCTYEKVPKNWAGPPPPPLIWTKSKKTAVFIVGRKNQRNDLQSQYHNVVI